MSDLGRVLQERGDGRHAPDFGLHGRVEQLFLDVGVHLVEEGVATLVIVHGVVAKGWN